MLGFTVYHGTMPGENTPEVGSMDESAPTEELYIKLRRLEAAATDTTSPNAASTIHLSRAANDDTTGLKARIAALRALLSDRGVGTSE